MRELCKSVDKSHPARDRSVQKNSAARVRSGSPAPCAVFLRIINVVGARIVESN